MNVDCTSSYASEAVKIFIIIFVVFFPSRTCHLMCGQITGCGIRLFTLTAVEIFLQSVNGLMSFQHRWGYKHFGSNLTSMPFSRLQ